MEIIPNEWRDVCLALSVITDTHLGHFEFRTDYIAAICDTVPIITYGKSEEESLERMADAINIYTERIKIRSK